MDEMQVWRLIIKIMTLYIDILLAEFTSSHLYDKTTAVNTANNKTAFGTLCKLIKKATV
jgi:hypothetical protein